jgi:hypothetical protein
MQAILLTTSLLIVALMLASLAWLAANRGDEHSEAIAADVADEPA